MKVKGQILICTAIMLNDHSNPYIESTTVLSDIHIDRQRGPVVRLGGVFYLTLHHSICRI